METPVWGAVDRFPLLKSGPPPPTPLGEASRQGRAGGAAIVSGRMHRVRGASGLSSGCTSYTRRCLWECCPSRFCRRAPRTPFHWAGIAGCCRACRSRDSARLPAPSCRSRSSQKSCPCRRTGQTRSSTRTNLGQHHPDHLRQPGKTACRRQAGSRWSLSAPHPAAGTTFADSRGSHSTPHKTGWLGWVHNTARCHQALGPKHSPIASCRCSWCRRQTRRTEMPRAERSGRECHTSCR